MNVTNSNTEKAANLRKKAEELLKKKSSEAYSSHAEIEILKLIHELEMHQIELEMQNEELLLAKQQAEADADKYSELYDFAPSGYFTLSKEGKIIELNLNASKILGKERAKLVNRPFGIFVSNDTKPIFDLFLANLFKNNTNAECEICLLSNTNSPINIHLIAIYSAEKDQYNLTVVDISERKQIENELKQSEAKFRTLFESANDAIFIMNDKVFIGCNSKTEILFGCRQDEIIGHSPTEFSPLMQPDGRLSSEKSAERIHAALAGNPQFFYWQHIRYNGSPMDAEVSLNKIEINGEDYLQAIVRDISDQKQAERALKESEEKYRLLAEHMTDIVWLMDMDFRVTYQSPSSEKLRGFNSQEIKDLPMEKNLTPESLKLALESFSSKMQLIATNKDYSPLTTMELEYYCKDGTTVWLENKFSLLRNGEGKPISILGEGRDITNRRKADEALRIERWRLASIVEATRAGTWEWNLQTGETVLNKQYAQMLGYTLDELSPTSAKTWETLTHTTDLEHSYKLLEQHFTGELPYYDCEFRMKHKEGHWVWIHDRGRVITRTSDGKPLMMFGTHTDISDRKKAENALKMSESHANALIEAMPDLMFRLSSQGVFLDYKAAKEDLVYQQQSIIGKSIREIFPPEFANMVDSKVARTIQDGQMLIFEYQLPLPSIGIREYEARMVPSGPEEVITIVRDITERKIAEAQIILKNEQLIQANLEKDKFFSIIAHDLRSPFNAFLGFTQMLVEDLDTMTLKEIQQIAQYLRSSATNLFRLLENLLEWSRIRRGVTSFTPEKLILKSIIEESLQPVVEAADKKGVEIKHDISDVIQVFADEFLFKSTMRNLVTNAVKFTNKGGSVIISASSLADNAVEVSIKDSGIGMSSKILDNLFRLDEQTNRKGTEGEPSSGLGLIICKEFIEKNGGKLWIESEENIGSIFYFTVPVENILLT